MLRILFLLSMSLWLFGCASAPPYLAKSPLPVEPMPVQTFAVVEERPILIVSRPPDYPFTGCLPVLNNLSNEEASETRWHMEKVQTWFQQMDRLDACDSVLITELTEPVFRTQIVNSVYMIFRKVMRLGCDEHYKNLIVQIRDWENTFLDHRRCQR